MFDETQREKPSRGGLSEIRSGVLDQAAAMGAEFFRFLRQPSRIGHVVLPAFSLKFKIQEFKMAKNGHGGKRAGAGRPPLLPAEAKPERMKGAAGDITLSPARLLSPASPWR